MADERALSVHDEIVVDPNEWGVADAAGSVDIGRYATTEATTTAATITTRRSAVPGFGVRRGGRIGGRASRRCPVP
jgi:hypothetical protein